MKQKTFKILAVCLALALWMLPTMVMAAPQKSDKMSKAPAKGADFPRIKVAPRAKWPVLDASHQGRFFVAAPKAWASGPKRRKDACLS